MMQVFINDQAHNLQGQDVSALLQEIGAAPERVVVVVNGTVVPQAQRTGYALHAQDRIDMFTFAGGG